MSKELEALEEIKDYIEDNITTKYNHVEPEIKIIQSALKHLETIDNVDTNEALKVLEKIKTKFRDVCLGLYLEDSKEFAIIKQALIKAQEQEKVLEIIKEKKVNTLLLELAENVDEYNERIVPNGQLTQEEFNLLKRYLCQNE